MSHIGSAICNVILYLALTHNCDRPVHCQVTLVWRYNVQLLSSHIRALPPRHFAEWIGPGPMGLCRARFSREEGLYNRRKDELHNLGPTAAVALLPASRCRHHSEQHHWKGELRAEVAQRFAEIHHTSLTGSDGGTSLRAGRPRGLGSITDRVKGLFPPLKRPKQFYQLIKN